MNTAERSTWKTLPDPDLQEKLYFDAFFSSADMTRIREGLIPQAMEDKWFVFFEDDWLRFHRSWTGAAIYALLLECESSGARVVESWVNRDPEQYRGTDLAYDRELLRFIIDALLLGKPAEFPLPSNADGSAPGVTQHHYVGRGYPERPSGDKPKGNT